MGQCKLPGCISEDTSEFALSDNCVGDEAMLSTKSRRMRGTRARFPSTDSESARAPFVLDSRGQICESYDLHSDQLGAGAFGFVYRAVHRVTGAKRAIKKILLADVDDCAWRREVEFLKALDHPNIIRLYESVESRKCAYLAFELAEGGDLFDRIIAAKRLGEDDGRAVMRDVLRAVRYLHSRDAVHRDIKPENFLLLSKGPIAGNALKLADFGCATACEAGQVLQSNVGTSFYIAPQVLKQRYSRECDLWSAGVLMFVVLAGSMPFAGRTDAEVRARVRRGHYDFKLPVWRSISKAAKDLIKNLLRLAPNARLTAEQALSHGWFKDDGVSECSTALLDDRDLECFSAYSAENVLKKSALQIIARQLSDVEVKRQRDIFIELDQNDDGMLSESELAAGLVRQGLEPDSAVVRRLLQIIAEEGREGVQYTEFLAATLQSKSYIERNVCWTAFNVFDLDGDGRISLDELEQVLQQGLGSPGERTALKSLLAEHDIDGDGTLSFQEFMRMMGLGARSAAVGGA
mmetsp:Transcript_15609/g.45047  ORF Transcript_15609/g.45047 Transcript_15609/m.45047 type:complete len:520 (+) Transcript_15609:49-1608(+)